MDLYTYLNYTKDYIPIEIIYKEDEYRIWDQGTAGEIKEKRRREELVQWEMLHTKSHYYQGKNILQIYVREMNSHYE